MAIGRNINMAPPRDWYSMSVRQGGEERTDVGGYYGGREGKMCSMSYENALI